MGHTILDDYTLKDQLQSKKYVIYAPHFSIGNNTIKYSTFLWSGYLMLSYAKTHPEMNWVFKPHPGLRRTLVDQGLMTIEQVTDYFDAWKKIGIIHDGPDYLDIFRQSKCLITDCGSFLVEYFPTKNPVINLVSNLSKQPCYALKRILKNYYRPDNPEELISLLNLILLDNQDPMKEQRHKAVCSFMGNDKKTAALRILKDLEDVIFVD